MLPGTPPSEIEVCHCFALKKAARQLSRFYDSHLQPSGLRITQFLILAAVKEMKSVPINALAECLDIERTAMGKMVGVLARDALVKLVQSSADGRSRLVELSEKGLKRYEKAVGLCERAQQQFMELNGPKKVSTLRRSLADMKVTYER